MMNTPVHVFERKGGLKEMKVFAIVGPSGSGKSSVINRFQSLGFTTMTEKYLDSYPSQLINNRELLSKWSWSTRWIDHILEYKMRDTNIVMTDRCPLETVPYASDGNLILDPLKHILKELQNHDIWVKTIYLRVPHQICFRRCKARIEKEPKRVNYGETDWDYTASIHEFYEQCSKNLWDFTVETSGKSIDDIASEIKIIIEGTLNESRIN